MIEGKEYIDIVRQFYFFLEEEFSFKEANTAVNGNAFYDIEFRNNEKAVSISYENIEDHLEIVVFILQSGKMPNYDDKTKTLHLKQFNMMILAKVNKDEINSNAEYFSHYNVNNNIEQKLLKGAKELRLCLKHFNE
jgi:hypothetical protein